MNQMFTLKKGVLRKTVVVAGVFADVVVLADPGLKLLQTAPS